MVLIDEYDHAGRPFDTGQQLFGIQLPVHRGNRSALQPQPGHGRRHQPALHPLCQNERRPHGRRPRGKLPLYAERKRDFPYKIAEDAPCCREFLRHGFTWGGHWKSLKDYQHFEKKQ